MICCDENKRAERCLDIGSSLRPCMWLFRFTFELRPQFVFGFRFGLNESELCSRSLLLTNTCRENIPARTREREFKYPTTKLTIEIYR
eukprot:4903810-Pyramimonas_sp.AAC.1